MAGLILGDFAGGIGQGIEQGQNIKERYRKMAQEKRLQAARDDYSAWLAKSSNSPISAQGGGQPAPQGPPKVQAPPMGGGGGAPAPMGAQLPPRPPQMAAPQLQQPQQPRPMPMPGARPMSGAGQPPGQPGMMGLPPGQGAGGAPGANAPPAPPPQGAPPRPPMAAQPPPQGAPPMQRPPTPGPPKGSAAMPAAQMSGTGSGQQLNPNDPLSQPQALVQSIAKQIAMQFPGRKWKHDELLSMVEQDVGLMKDVDPTVRQIAQLQIQLLKDSVSRDNTQDRVAATERGQDMNATNVGMRVAATERGQDLTHEDRVSAIKASLQKQDMADATRLQAEDIIQAGANGRTAAVNEAREQIADEGLDEKEWAIQVAAQLKQQGMADAFISKIFGAQASNAPAGGAPAPPKRGIPQPLPRPPGRGGGGGGAPPPPKVGEVVQGHRFKGGNPADPKSWTPA